MIRFKIYEDYIQYVDGMADCDRENIDQNRIVDGWSYNLCSVHCPQLYISYYNISYHTRHVSLYLPGYGTDKDYNKIYFNKADKDVILKLFEVFKDILQLEGADRWIL